MSKEEAEKLLVGLGIILNQCLGGEEDPSAVGKETLNESISKTYDCCPFFTKKEVNKAMRAWVLALEPTKIRKWISMYEKQFAENRQPKRIGVIMPGNVPLVGLHDLICVIISGNIFVGKCSGNDPFLIPAIVQLWGEKFPILRERIEFATILVNTEAVIATGSKNSNRYFKYLFGSKAHLFRQNRNSVAVLNGNESDKELSGLANDILDYYGLGCRSISKLMVPEGYDFAGFISALEKSCPPAPHLPAETQCRQGKGGGLDDPLLNNRKYFKALLQMMNIPIIEAGDILLVKEPTPVSGPPIVGYEYYSGTEHLSNFLKELEETIQCISSSGPIPGFQTIPLGKTQVPELWDYSDGIDTMKFLADC